MTELDEESVRQWSLNVSDSISTKLKSNIHFKDFITEEITYSQFLESNKSERWTTLCEQKELNQSIMTLISYSSIICTTNQFFSNIVQTESINNENLTFTETFIAEAISNEIAIAFNQNELDISFIRNEKKLSLVHPFHEDESIIVYKFSWYIGDDHIGELVLCHSHVL